MASKNLQQRLDDAKEELASARSAIDDARRDGNRRVEAEHEKMRGLARQLEKTGRALLGANNQIHTMTDRCGVLEAWGEEVRARLEPLALVGSVVRPRSCLVVPRADMTEWFSTPCALACLKALPDMTIAAAPDAPAFLPCHPVALIPYDVRL